MLRLQAPPVQGHWIGAIPPSQWQDFGTRQSGESDEEEGIEAKKTSYSKAFESQKASTWT